MDDEIVNLTFGQLPASVVEGTQATSQVTIEDTISSSSHQRCAGIRFRRNNHAVRPREHPGGREHRRPIHGHG